MVSRELWRPIFSVCTPFRFRGTYLVYDRPAVDALLDRMVAGSSLVPYPVQDCQALPGFTKDDNS